jgi:hypothetical protein
MTAIPETVKTAVLAALAPFFSSPTDDAPSLDLAGLTEPDAELSELLLATVSGKPEPRLVIGRLKGQSGTTVQAIIFPKADFPDMAACHAWLERNNMSAGKADETDDSWRYRQRDPGDFEPGSFRTITPGQRQVTEPAAETLSAVAEFAEVTHTQDFLAEFRRLVNEQGKSGTLTDADLMECMKKARAHAGGMAASKNRQMAEAPALTDPVALNEFTWGVELAEIGKPIQIMRTGEFQHPEYGKFAITPQDLAEIKANFDAQVRGQDIPIDVDHDHEGGAVGWMKSLAVKDDTLWATPEWTDQGAQDVAAGKYRYFSPHFGPWRDPESGAKHRVVLMSGAITNFPFLKGMEPITLSEFSNRKGGKAVGVTVEELEKRLSESEAKATAEATERERLLTESAERETKLTDQIKELTDRQARMERDGMVKRLSERIRGNGNPNHRIIGDEDKKIALVVKLAETFGEESEEVTDYLADQEAASTALREAGVFSEVGTSVGAPPITGQFEAKLKEFMAANPSLNRGQAASKVLSENPELYRQYNAAQPTGAPRN